jgi:hypothetical protein
VNLATWAGQNNVQVAFRNKGDWGNIIFLDNINLGSSVGINEVQNIQAPSVYPNPLRAGGTINIKNLPKSSLSLFDGKGKRVWEAKAENEFQGTLPSTLSAGWYLLHIEGEKTIWNYKVVVE